MPASLPSRALLLALTASLGCSGGTGAISGGGSVGSSDVLEKCSDLVTQPGVESEWVGFDASGKLSYGELDDNHNRILDYSHAGPLNRCRMFEVTHFINGSTSGDFLLDKMGFVDSQ